MGKESYKTNDVTFVNSKNVPFQRWYPYIEGYSPDFVSSIIKQNVPDAKLVYEPFAGTGTTLFASDSMNIPTVYSEVNPLLRYLISVKLKILTTCSKERHQLAAKLHKIADNLLEESSYHVESNELLTAYQNVFGKSVYFPEEQYSIILRLRTYIDNLAKEEPIVAKLLSIACFSCLLPVSFLKKQGDVRFKTAKEKETQMKRIEDVLPKKVHQIADDVNDTDIVMNCVHNLLCANAKQVKNAVLSNKIDAVITSPPYLNGTNYFRNTKLELWFLRELKEKKDLRMFRDDALTSAICDVKKEYNNKNIDLKSPLFDKTFMLLQETAYDRRIPLMAKCYFAEMYELFSGLTRHLNRGAKLYIDLGDSIFGGVHISTDLILNEVLEGLGYNVDDRIVLRERRSRNNEIISQVLLKYSFNHV
jgi:DNA modification methylase